MFLGVSLFLTQSKVVILATAISKQLLYLFFAIFISSAGNSQFNCGSRSFFIIINHSQSTNQC